MRDVPRAESSRKAAGNDGVMERGVVHRLVRSGRAQGESHATTLASIPVPAGIGSWFVHRASAVIAAIVGCCTVLVIGFAALFPVERVVVARGRLEPREVVTARAGEGGMISEVLVREGDAVTKGAAIAVLDTMPLALQRARVDAEIAALEAQMEARALDSRLDALVLAEQVQQRVADTLRTSADLREQFAEAGTAGGQFGYSPGNHVRLDRALAAHAAARSSLRERELMRDGSTMGGAERREMQHRITALRVDRDALTQRIRRGVIRAPIDGVILTPDVEMMANRHVASGDGVLDVSSAGDWEVLLGLAESDVVRVAVGAPVRLELIAVHQELDGTRVGGIIQRIALDRIEGRDGAAVGDVGQSTYRATVQLEQGSVTRLRALGVRPGMSVEARIIGRAEPLLAWLVDRILRP